MPGVTIDELGVADEAAAWAALGFAVDGDACRIGGVRLHFAGRGAGRGVVGWTLRGARGGELDGLATELAAEGDASARDAAASTTADVAATAAGDAPPDSAPAHPNGATAIDHVVVITPVLDRTIAAFRAAGLDLRRIREEPTPAGAPRQAFFRLGGEIVEVVQEPDEAIERAGGTDRPAIFWGLALRVPDLRAAVERIGADKVSEIRPAVQPGREIATLRRAAGIAVPVALMTP